MRAFSNAYTRFLVSMRPTLVVRKAVSDRRDGSIGSYLQTEMIGHLPILDLHYANDPVKCKNTPDNLISLCARSPQS